MTVLPGSEVSAGVVPATLKLARGGQVRICSQSQITINSGGQGMLVAMSTGSLEVNYRLEQSASDLVVTPDFNIRLAGPGSYHFALGVNGQGDTCFKSLPGNTAGVVFSEPLGSVLEGVAADEAAFFPAGKLARRAALDHPCGCPIASVPALTASAPAETPSRLDGNPGERPAAATESSSSPEAPTKNHLEVETPFVFSATAAALPGGVAQIDFSALPNVYLSQDESDPAVPSVKPPAPPASTSAKPVAASVVQAAARAEPAKEPDKKKQKRGFGARVKGFFGSLFGH
jgi:hypothetical protein